MESFTQLEMVGCPAPHQLAIMIVKGDTVMAIRHGLTQAENKLHSNRAERGQHVWIFSTWLDNLPADKTVVHLRRTSNIF